MAVTASATAPAVPQDWLTVDQTSAARGYGPAEFGDPKASPPVPMVPGGASPLGAAYAPVAPDAPGTVYDGAGGGAWPALPDSGDGRDWQDRGDGFPQGLRLLELPHTDAPGRWNSSAPLQTYDHLSQHVDPLGWDQTVPNDRVSARNTFGAALPDNNPTWYGYSENTARARLAVTGQPYTVDQYQHGTPGFSAGALPDWSMSGGQGNTAYETPSPPPAGSPSTMAAADPGARWA